MARSNDSVTAEQREFIAEQPLFFVATAPLVGDGHVNLSPKGLDSFRVLSESRVAYLDLTGSGNETAAHVTENRRITLMWCSFGKRPKILRIYGKGSVVLSGAGEWAELAAMFPEHSGVRQIIVVDVDEVRESCGHGVPEMTLVEQREMIPKWAQVKGEEGLAEYREQKNAVSLDGLPAPGFTSVAS
jgi:hypothetical protein